MRGELATRRLATGGLARAVWRQVGLSLVASLAVLAQRAAVPGQGQPAGTQNVHRLTALNSAYDCCQVG